MNALRPQWSDEGKRLRYAIIAKRIDTAPTLHALDAAVAEMAELVEGESPELFALVNDAVTGMVTVAADRMNRARRA